MFAKILMLLVFFTVMLLVGVACRKHARSVDGFVLGGRSVGAWFTAFAFGTSYFSAVIFVGYAGQFGWRFGLASTWIGLGNAFIGSLLAWVILGRRTRIMTQHLNSRTMPDFFGLRYQSPALKITAAVIVFVFLIPYTASLFNGLSRLFTMAFPGIDYTWCVIIMAVLTGIYVTIGGYMATAVNDFIQGIVMLFGIVAVIAAVLNGQGGLSEAIARLSQTSITTSEGSEFRGAFSSFFGADPEFLFFVVILTSLGTWGLPQMVNKFYAIRDEASIKKGTVISTVFALIVAGGCYFLGGFGRLFAPSVEYQADGVTPVFDSIIPAMLQGLSPALIGIVLVLVLSASMSTLSSLVLTSSSTITLDFIDPLCRKKLKEKHQMRIMQAFIGFFILTSAVIAIIQAKSNVVFIAQLMGVSWGALAGAFLAPFLYGLFWKRTTKAACWISFGWGVGLSLIQLIKTMTGFEFGIAFLDHTVFASSIHSGAIAMLTGLVIVPLFSLVTKKPDMKKVEEIFSCYNEKITVPVKETLGEQLKST